MSRNPGSYDVSQCRHRVGRVGTDAGVVAGTLAAQEWPSYPADQLPGRGPGDYLAWYKLLACWFGRRVLGPRRPTGSIATRSRLGTISKCPPRSGIRSWCSRFLVAFLLAITIPVFAVGYALLIIAYVAPLATYIMLRNGRVTDDQKVLTAGAHQAVAGRLASGKKRRNRRHADSA